MSEGKAKVLLDAEEKLVGAARGFAASTPDNEPSRRMLLREAAVKFARVVDEINRAVELHNAQ